jgi:Zn finger protein HypA/HybF involved in hydrogenase expression
MLRCQQCGEASDAVEWEEVRESIQYETLLGYKCPHCKSVQGSVAV